MLCADSLEDVAVWLGLKAAQWVSAQNIHVVCFDYFVPEMLDSNRRLCIALRPKQRYTFSADDNAGTFSLCSLCRCQKEYRSTTFRNRTGSGMIVDHECRERFGSVQRDVSPLLNRGTNIQAMSLQSQ